MLGVCILVGGGALLWRTYLAPRPPAATAQPVAQGGLPQAEPLPQRAPSLLEHPSGATAQLPGGPVLYSGRVELRQVEIPWQSTRWDHDGAVWELVSDAGSPFEEPVTLDLPAGGAPGEAVALLTPTGSWVEVPSTAGTLANGAPARRVKLSRVPAPWRLAVVTPKAGVAPPVEREVLRLEALYLSDREAWAEKTSTWLATGAWQEVDSGGGEASRLRLTSASLIGAFSPAPAPAPRQRDWADVEQDLETALLTLASVRLATDGAPVADLTARAFSVPLTGLDMTGFELYVAGVDGLAELRREWAGGRVYWIDKYGVDVLEHPFDDSQTMDQALESALYSYAPWGVELTQYLLRTGSLAGLDLRVLQPYGELRFADVPVPDTAKMRNRNIEEAITRALRYPKPGIDPSRAEVRRYLRLYSQSAVEDTSWIDWLKDWRTETVVRWLPVALAASGLIPGGAAVPLACAAADELLSWWQSCYETSETPQMYGYLEAASAATEVGGMALGLSVSSDVVQVGAQPGFQIPGGSYLGYAQVAYAVGLQFAVTHTDWYMLKDIRAVNAGTRGYCPQGKCPWFTSSVIPPIQVYAVLQGPLADQPPAAYPATATRLLAWHAPYAHGSLPDLHELYQRGVASECFAVPFAPDLIQRQRRGNWQGGLANMAFEPYKQDLWPLVVVRTNPDAQAIRIAIPAAELARIQQEHNLGPDPKFEDYGLVLRLETPDQKRTEHPLTQAAGRETDEQGEWVYVTAVLRQGMAEEAGWVHSYPLPEGYECEQQAAPGGELRRQLRARLLARGEELWASALDLKDGAMAPIKPLEPGDPESPRVQYVDVRMEAEQRPDTIPLTLHRQPDKVPLEIKGTLSHDGCLAGMDVARYTELMARVPSVHERWGAPDKSPAFWHELAESAGGYKHTVVVPKGQQAEITFDFTFPVEFETPHFRGKFGSWRLVVLVPEGKAFPHTVSGGTVRFESPQGFHAYVALYFDYQGEYHLPSDKWEPGHSREYGELLLRIGDAAKP